MMLKMEEAIIKFFIGFNMKIIIKWGKWTFGGGDSTGG